MFLNKKTWRNPKEELKLPQVLVGSEHDDDGSDDGGGCDDKHLLKAYECHCSSLTLTNLMG